MILPPKIHWALHLILLVLILILGVQRYSGTQDSQDAQQTQTVSRTNEDRQEEKGVLKVQENLVNRTVTTETEKKPDGTVKKKVTKSDTRTQAVQQSVLSKEVNRKETSEETESSQSSQSSRSSYSLALSWTPLRLNEVPYIPAQVTVGARLGNLPLFLEVTSPISQPSLPKLMLGIRVEF